MATTIDTYNRHDQATDTTWAAIGYRETGNHYTLDTPAAVTRPATHKPVPRPCR